MQYRLKSLAAISVSVGALTLPLNVHALLANCTASLASIGFGSYASPGTANSDSSGTVSVTCTGVNVLVSYSIALGTGSGSYANRKLISGTNFLSYNMYIDPTRLQIWGDGSAGTSTITNAYLLGLTSVTTATPVYGRIPGGQSQPAGTYNDTVIVTVTY